MIKVSCSFQQVIIVDILEKRKYQRQKRTVKVVVLSYP